MGFRKSGRYEKKGELSRPLSLTSPLQRDEIKSMTGSIGHDATMDRGNFNPRCEPQRRGLLLNTQGEIEHLFLPLSFSPLRCFRRIFVRCEPHAKRHAIYIFGFPPRRGLKVVSRWGMGRSNFLFKVSLETGLPVGKLPPFLSETKSSKVNECLTEELYSSSPANHSVYSSPLNSIE